MTQFLRLLAFLYILSSTAIANGFLIYKDQSFHTDQQTRFAEYVTAESVPQIVSVTLKSGSKLDIPVGRSPVLIPFPKDSLEEPETIIKRIDSAIARFPQYKTKLESAKSEWIIKKKKIAEENAQSDNGITNSTTVSSESVKAIKF